MLAPGAARADLNAVLVPRFLQRKVTLRVLHWALTFSETGTERRRFLTSVTHYFGELLHGKVLSRQILPGRGGTSANEERAIQGKIDRSDRKATHEHAEKGAMQAGARAYPEPPLPGQHLEKPGLEADLKLQPMYEAPHYKGSDRTKIPLA
jgi:hypothetical protein